jgi:multicomponent K+:H+ antiporter subunit G
LTDLLAGIAAHPLDALLAALLVAGGTFALIGSIGLARLGDFYKRIHGPTKATTLGVGGTLLASCLFFSVLEGRFSSRELLVALFLFITAPVSAQLLVQAALAGRPGDRPAPPAPQPDSSSTASAVPSTGTTTVNAPTAG